MRVTIRDVAKQLNLSHTTVSRVLNDKDSINIPLPTRERVRRAAQEMGYQPNHAARLLATGKTQLISLQLNRLNSPYSAQVSQEMQRLVRPHGYEVVVREFGHGADLALETAVDGIIALDAAHYPNDRPANSRPPVPYIGIGAYYAPGLDFVGVDLYAGARAAMEHLLATGRRTIHMVAVPPRPERRGDPRREAYEDAMREAGLKPVYVTVEGEQRIHSRTALPSYIEKFGCPEALFCINDELAMGCYRALYDRGLRIPDDVAVVGCDGIEETEYLQPPLTTIVQPVAELCRLGWEFLQRRMQEPSAPQQSALLTPVLATRASTGS